MCIFISIHGIAVAATPSIQRWSPGKVPLGATTVRVYGDNFNGDAVVKLEGTALPTTFVSSSELRASSNVSQSGSGNITVTNPGMPDEVSPPRLVEFGAGIVLSITSATVPVAAGNTKQFIATVSGAADTEVSWYVNGGDANGTISSTGLYRAPATPPATPVTIRIVSSANSERQATATVTVTPSTTGVSLNISPTSTNVEVGATRQFTATVTGSANTTVVWTVNNVVNGTATVGTVSNSGLYTAPAVVPNGSITVRATSLADTRKSATALLTVTSPPSLSVTISPTSASVQ